MWIMSKRFPPEQRARAVKMMLDHLDEYRSVYAACQAIGPKVGAGVESLRQWTVQAQIDAQQVPGPTTVERQRFKDLEREVRDLKEANEIQGGPPRFLREGTRPSPPMICPRPRIPSRSGPRPTHVVHRDACGIDDLTQHVPQARNERDRVGQCHPTHLVCDSSDR